MESVGRMLYVSKHWLSAEKEQTFRLTMAAFIILAAWW